MKTFLTMLALAGFASAAQAQSLEEKRDEKLKAPFLSQAAWITDYAKAKEEAGKNGKLIFAYFTRSYAY